MPTHGDDGGPAFPTDGGVSYVAGMTLRDWFAGQALAGAMVDDENGVEDHDKMAAYCYRQADAMIAARNWG